MESETNSAVAADGRRLICRAQMIIDEHTPTEKAIEALDDDTIQYLDLEIRHSFLQSNTIDTFSKLMTAIGAMVNLQRLDICCIIEEEVAVENGDHQNGQHPNNQHPNHHNHNNNQNPDNRNNVPQRTSLSVSSLQHVFEKTTSLTHLVFRNLNLSGTLVEFESMAKEISRLKSLQCVVVSDLTLSHSPDSVSQMDPVLQSIMSMPKLSHFFFAGSGSEPLQSLKPNTLQKCLESTSSLTALCLGQIQLSTHELKTLSRYVSRSRTLRKLDLQCCVTVEGAHALTNMLRENTCLTELTLRLVDDITAAPKSTANGLQLRQFFPGFIERLEEEEEINQNIDQVAAQALEVDDQGDDNGDHPENERNEATDDDDDDDEVDSSSENRNEVLISDPQLVMEYHRNCILAEGVIANDHLKVLELSGVNLSLPSLQIPFRKMLQDNYSLDKLELKCSQTNRSCLEQEIAFYIGLNQLGRGHLFQCHHCAFCDASYVSMLCHLLEEKEMDLSQLFYFLLQKPHLISTCDTERQEPPSNPRKRKRLYRAAKYNRVRYTYKN